MGYIKLRGFVLISILAAVIHTLYAVTTSDDKYWHDRVLAAKEANDKAAHPDPLKQTHHFNFHAHRRMQSMNLTHIARNLGSTGGCVASNPIDKCWRCDPDWEANRKKLASCVMGFGHGTTGGAAGEIYEVTDASDNDLAEPKPGTLRYGCLQEKPLWIIFKQDMNIKLNGELMLTPDKTVDGRGAKIHIANGGSFNIFLTKNIIIHGIHIHNIVGLPGGRIIRDSPEHEGRRGPSDGDAIGIFGSSNVWIDHVSFSTCEDGLVDAINGSTAITISNCHFTKHDHVILLGAKDSNTDDAKMQVTVAYNHFDKGLVQRMPRGRSGFFHVVNNDYTEWEMYAIGGTHNPTIMSQGNRFYAPSNPNAKQVTSQNKGCSESEWKNWKWSSEGDQLLNGAIFVQSGSSVSHGGPEMIKALPVEGIAAITGSAGALNCVPKQPC